MNFQKVGMFIISLSVSCGISAAAHRTIADVQADIDRVMREQADAAQRGLPNAVQEELLLQQIVLMGERDQLEVQGRAGKRPVPAASSAAIGIEASRLVQVTRELQDVTAQIDQGFAEGVMDQQLLDRQLELQREQEALLVQVGELSAPVAQWEVQAQTEGPQGEQLYCSEAESSQDLRDRGFLDYYAVNGRVSRLPERLQRLASGAQFIQLRSFRQATELCGYAALANLYAINEVLHREIPITYMDVSIIAKQEIDIIDKVRRGLTGHYSNMRKYDEAGYEELMIIAREIRFKPELFMLSLFDRGSSVAQGSYGGRATALFEDKPREEGIPYQVSYSYSGARRDYEDAAFQLTENRHYVRESEEVVFANVIRSLQTQQTTNFILNSERGHYMAACVVRQAEKFVIYYMDSVNTPIQYNDFNQINFILWIDHLIQLAQRSSADPAGAGAGPASGDAVDVAEQYILANKQIIKGITARLKNPDQLNNPELAEKIRLLIQEIKGMKTSPGRMSEVVQQRAAKIQKTLQTIIERFGAQ